MTAESASAAWLAFDAVEIDTLGHRLFVDREEVGLEPKAFAVLVLLASDPGRVMTRDEILDAVWGHSHVTPAVLSRIIALLRHALGESAEDSRYLHTVHGVGFRLDAQVRSAASRDGLVADSALVDTGAKFASPPTSNAAVPLGATLANPARPLPLVKRRWFDRRMIAVIMGLFVLTVVVLGGYQIARRPADTASLVDNKSVAVLPFENLSGDQSNAYFATGMQDMVLTKLVGIGGLKVVSRTSTEQYPSHPPDVKTIARQLGVATLLEGSVQKAGNKVLINVQLIDPYRGNHLWAQAYTRSLDDVFNVEGEVAQQVADALQVQLTAAEAARISRPSTKNAAAYDLYLQADTHASRATALRHMSAHEVTMALSLYQQALAKDPDFALAWAALARADMLMYYFGHEHTAERLAAAKAAADRALALQPDLGEGYFALALYYYWGHRDYAAAMTQLERARVALPNSAAVELVIADILVREGRWDEALAVDHAITVFDRHNDLAFNDLGLTYQFMRRYDEADKAFAAAVDLANGNATIWRLEQADNVRLWKGDLAPLRTVLAAFAPGSEDYVNNLGANYFVRWLARDYAGAAKVAETSEAGDWLFSNNIAVPRRLCVAWALQATGDRADATASYAEVKTYALIALVERPDDADLHLALGFAYAGLGRNPEAVAEGERAVALVPAAKDAINGPAMLEHLAELYVRVRQPDKAVPLLERLLAMPAGAALSAPMLRLDPVWDPLRSDPRFKALLLKYPGSGQSGF